MINILSFIYLILCVLLILVILIQVGKGGGLVATFGGGASSSLFGPRRATILTRTTAIIGTLFMLLAFSLSLIVSKPISIVKQKKGEVKELPLFTPATPTGTLKTPTEPQQSPLIPQKK